jgi:hypothetical protein
VEDYPVKKFNSCDVINRTILAKAFLLPYAQAFLDIIIAENQAWNFPPINSTSPAFFFG